MTPLLADLVASEAEAPRAGGTASSSRQQPQQHVDEYGTLRRLATLSVAAWSQPLWSSTADAVIAREGSALARLTHDTCVIIGGWTTMGLANDVVVMRLCKPSSATLGQVEGDSPNLPRLVPTLEVQTCSGSRGRVAGPPLPHRYGHSATTVRVVLPGQTEHVHCVLVFGGMQSGGYTGEQDDAWLLHPDEETVANAWAGMWSTVTWRWQRIQSPNRGGAWPPARGYHSACASADGTRVYIFGGIAHHDCVDDLWQLDTTTWTWTALKQGAAAMKPNQRFGSSLVCLPEVSPTTLWLFGGADGADLLRDGEDKTDVWTLDTSTNTWTEVEPANEPLFPRTLGRCHTAVPVGAKVVFFGGSMLTSRAVQWFDAETRMFGAPHVAACLMPGISDGDAQLDRFMDVASFQRSIVRFFRGTRGALETTHTPSSRFTHMAALLGGSRMLITCGWQMHGGSGPRGCVNDVWLLDLAPRHGAVARAKAQRPEALIPTVTHDWDDDDDDDDEYEEDGSYEEDEDEGVMVEDAGAEGGVVMHYFLGSDGDGAEEEEEEYEDVEEEAEDDPFVAEDPVTREDARTSPGDDEDEAEDERGSDGGGDDAEAADDQGGDD